MKHKERECQSTDTRGQKANNDTPAKRQAEEKVNSYTLIFPPNNYEGQRRQQQTSANKYKIMTT